MIERILQRYRTWIFILIFILGAGSIAMQNIVKESMPDVSIPIMYISAPFAGTAAKDMDRLVVKVLESELSDLEDVKEITSHAINGHASVQISFNSNADLDQSLIDVREKVQRATSSLPANMDAPSVHEINTALFPVLLIALSSDGESRELYQVAKSLQDAIEQHPDVFEAELVGSSDEMVEVIVLPEKLENYGIDIATAANMIGGNSEMITAGFNDRSDGRLSIKTPNTLADLTGLLSQPVAREGDRIITLQEVAVLRRTFQDPKRQAFIDGQRALTLEVSRRTGANVIDTIAAVKEITADQQSYWPDDIRLAYSQDQSVEVKNDLSGLYNNVILAVLLVMMVIFAFLNVRSALLIGLVIPSAFLSAILILYLAGITLNIVVLFALILSIGILVDNGIVINEYAERLLDEGKSPIGAYAASIQSLGWPIVVSTLTTLIAFMPLMFWPDVIGKFMRYLPLTLMVTLSCSLLAALLLMPSVGILISRFRRKKRAPETVATDTPEAFESLPGRAYERALAWSLRHPFLVMGLAILTFVGTIFAYGQYNHGTLFFPDVEPARGFVRLKAAGSYSLAQRRDMIEETENYLRTRGELKNIYSKIDVSEDSLARIDFELGDWWLRRAYNDIRADIEAWADANLNGITLETLADNPGPGSGEGDIHIQVSALSETSLLRALATLYDIAGNMDGLRALRDDRSEPATEWLLEMDLATLARHNLTQANIAPYAKLIAQGNVIGTYRPEDSSEGMDIVLRYPKNDRHMGKLLNANFGNGEAVLPFSQLVSTKIQRELGTIQRIDNRLAYNFYADLANPGEAPSIYIAKLAEAFATADIEDGVRFEFAGDAEEQARTGQFLMSAFLITLLGMFLALLFQFNSVRQVGIIFTAIVFSIIGVLWGLLLAGQPFGVVMCGIGIITLAGIVINNNIVLANTYNEFIAEGIAAREAAIFAARKRLRPVLLTAGTTVLGLMPMVMQLDINFINQVLNVNSPSSQWWVQLSTVISGGLSFATVITLLITPALLVVTAPKRHKYPETHSENYA